MRRIEFEEKEQAEIDAFLAVATFGTLATYGQDFPGVTPLNFVWYEESIYFHGSRVGQKMKDMARDPRASFAVAEEMALIPSYFVDPELACPATSFFKSVVVRGRLEEVTDLDAKVRIFSAFMTKLQPEGGYAPFDLDNRDYYKNVKGTCVVRLTTEALTAKFKFGQNRKEKDWNATIQGLESRAKPGDAQATVEMKKRCPFH